MVLFKEILAEAFITRKLRYKWGKWGIVQMDRLIYVASRY